VGAAEVSSHLLFEPAHRRSQDTLLALEHIVDGGEHLGANSGILSGQVDDGNFICARHWF